MLNPTRVLCVVLTLLALIAPAAALANHEGGAPPGQGGAPSGQGGAPSGQAAAAVPSSGTQQGDDDTSTLASVGTLVGLLVVGGALVAVRESRRRRSPEGPVTG